MGIELIIGAIGLGISAAGTIAQYQGQQKQAKAAKRSEQLREKQMNLDATRQRRQAIRQAILARSQALTSGANQGAGVGSSGVQGAIGQATNTEAQSVLGVNQNQSIGGGIFSANRDYAAGGTMAATGQGISSLGGALFNNAGTITRIAGFAS